MSVEASPVYLTIQWKDLPASIRITDHADGAIRSGRLHDGGLDAASRLPVTIPATTDDGRIVSLSITSVNRRPKRTPYRRAKGTPFVEQRNGYDGRTVRAGCGVGRA